MILEAYKIVSSIWPLIKEVFLWRDGAEAGKPITNQNLIRRKIAVFALLGSLLYNYFVTGKAIELYKQNTAYKKEVTQLNAELLKRPPIAHECLKPIDVVHMVQEELARRPYCIIPDKPKSNSKFKKEPRP